MIRILVTSDSHGAPGKLFSICEKHRDSVTYFVNLGDCRSGADLEYAESRLKIKLIRIAGNCDWYYDAPTLDFLNAGGKKILLCHGHTFSVKAGYDRLMDYAARSKCDAALFGHTHIQHYEYTNKIHFLCPGAVKNGEYAMLDIADGKILCLKAKL